MKFISTTALIAGVLMACSSLAQAQFNDGPHYDSHSVFTLVDRVHTDLDHAYRVRHFSNDDRDRLNHAEKELREFAHKWDHGKFDKGQLDDAVSSIQHVLDNNKLPQPERDSLSDDVSQLRKMREAYDHHEIGDPRG